MLYHSVRECCNTCQVPLFDTLVPVMFSPRWSWFFETDRWRTVCATLCAVVSYITQDMIRPPCTLHLVYGVVYWYLVRLPCSLGIVPWTLFLALYLVPHTLHVVPCTIYTHVCQVQAQVAASLLQRGTIRFDSLAGVAVVSALVKGMGQVGWAPTSKQMKPARRLVCLTLFPFVFFLSVCTHLSLISWRPENKITTARRLVCRT